MPGKIARIKNRGNTAVNPLAITRQNNFAPQLIAKLRQETMLVPVKLIFEKNCLVLNGLRVLEYEQGKHIARTFLRAGIKEITLKELPSGQEINALEQLIEAAEMSRIEPLIRARIAGLSVIQKIAELTNNEAVSQEIPGYYKHYTDHSGYQAIIQDRKLKPVLHNKNGIAEENIYLTPLELGSDEAHDLLFMGMPEYRSRGMFVVSFDILDPVLVDKVKNNGLELTLGEDICFNDPRINIRYHGPNPLTAAA